VAGLEILVVNMAVANLIRSGKSAQIANIISVIDGIAFQTNILALTGRRKVPRPTRRSRMKRRATRPNWRPCAPASPTLNADWRDTGREAL
jgi:Tfp pilus assembly pilus retraction ATPase PilT